jgi:glyoxylase-like metal-dependent hydrolase (beta-lactamase superfamily II)
VTAGGTVSPVRDADRVIVVDPEMAPSRSAILDPLAALGLSPADITDVVLSHHHLDHTVNIALFGEVPVHDVQAVYQRDTWIHRPAEGFSLTDSVRLLATSGHTTQDVTTLVGTADGHVRLTHLWWKPDGPAEDPCSPDRDTLREQRQRVLAVADRIVPGHPAPFAPSDDTPV